jgi:YVTN family beta-propeller protein
MKIACLGFVLLMSGVASFSASGYRLLKSIPVPGDGGWDFLTVDVAARRLYVSHGTQVEVLNTDSEVLVGMIPNTRGVHGVAIASELGRGFTSNGQAATVTIFDLKTLQSVGEVATGKNPDAIIYDPSTHRVFVFNGRSDSTTVIDAAEGKVATTIPLNGKPEFAVADGTGHVFANLEDKSEVLRLDSQKLTIDQRWPLTPCESPSSMAMDRPKRRLFIGCGNRVMAVVNADDGKVITTLPIGDHVDATAFDPETKLIFNSNGEGSVTVIHQESPDKYQVMETVKTQPGAKTMALDLKTHKIFLPVAEYGPPPAPTKERPHPRPSIVAGSFKILVLGR